MKICTKCGIEYPATIQWFYVRKLKSGEYRLKSECRKCFTYRTKEYRQRNKHRTAEEIKQDYENRRKRNLRRNLTYLLQLQIWKTHKKCPQCGAYFPKHEGVKCGKCKILNRTKTTKDGYKTCRKCSEEFPATLEYFNSDPQCIYGVKAVCKKCRYKQSAKWTKDNYEHVKKVREKNKETYMVRVKKWRENNRDKIRKRKNEYKSAKRKTDPMYRIVHSISRGMNDCLRGRKKGEHWEGLVGYTKSELKKHLEKLFKSGMSWENYGINGWHIDHIRPVASFNFTSPSDCEFKQCWALENLQPLWAEDIIKIGANWTSNMG